MSERERNEMGRGVTKRANYVKWKGGLRDEEMSETNKRRRTGTQKKDRDETKKKERVFLG